MPDAGSPADTSESLHRIGEYISLRKTMSKEQFLKSYWTPVLLVSTEQAQGRTGDLQTQLISVQSLRAAIARSPDSTAVVPVVKRMKDAFQSRIWVGREARCDVPLPFDTVSKLQAQFVRRPTGEYEIIDVGSTNGTFVEGTQLARNTPTVLRDNIRIQFGNLQVRFRTAEGFWEELGQL